MDKYGIIDIESIHYEGDERSRTHPGHGYPAYIETVTRLTEYKTKEDWEKAIKQKANTRFGRSDDFRAIIFREVAVETEVTINIDPR